MATTVTKNGRAISRRSLWAIRLLTLFIVIAGGAQTLPIMSGAALAGAFAGLGIAALVWYAILFYLASKPASGD